MFEFLRVVRIGDNCLPIYLASVRIHKMFISTHLYDINFNIHTYILWRGIFCSNGKILFGKFSPHYFRFGFYSFARERNKCCNIFVKNTRKPQQSVCICKLKFNHVVSVLFQTIYLHRTVD